MDSMSRTPPEAADVQAASQQRAKGRDSLFLMATLALADERTPRDVRVRNLSAGGLMIEIDRIVAEGTAATLTLRGIGEVAGSVAWCAEGRIGVAFDRPIDPMRARKPVGKGTGTPLYAKAQLS